MGRAIPGGELKKKPKRLQITNLGLGPCKTHASGALSSSTPHTHMCTDIQHGLSPDQIRKENGLWTHRDGLSTPSPNTHVHIRTHPLGSFSFWVKIDGDCEPTWGWQAGEPSQVLLHRKSLPKYPSKQQLVTNRQSAQGHLCQVVGPEWGWGCVTGWWSCC